MIDLSIAPEFKAKIPDVAVGWLTAIVRNSQHDEALWQKIEATGARFRELRWTMPASSCPSRAWETPIGLWATIQPVIEDRRGPGARISQGKQLLPRQHGGQ